MREVYYRKYIEPEYTNTAHSKELVPGTGQYSDFIFSGLFHQWGLAYEEFENGAVNFTVALVENEHGKIEVLAPSNIRFIKKS